jgi:hypothetical protein
MTYGPIIIDLAADYGTKAGLIDFYYLERDEYLVMFEKTKHRTAACLLFWLLTTTAFIERVFAK